MNTKRNWLQKNIHIVFGQIAERTLVDSGVVDFERAEVVALRDDLAVGELCDLSSDGALVERRKKSLMACECYEAHHPDRMEKDNVVEQDLATLKTLVEHYGDIDKIYLWTGCSASEIVATARLLYHLPVPALDRRIFMVGYPNVPVKSVYGDVIYPGILAATAAFQVKEIAKSFRQLTGGELQERKTLWKRLAGGNSQLRVRGKNGEILEKDETYFDAFLEANCSSEFQSAARVIGQTLCDIDSGVGDGYLSWRLKQLSRNKKVETCGTLSEIRAYKVRK
ncbi:MAG: DUF1835 domain-containing protein [Prevotellaceae bacterium]|jgi:hypothetical protein|nr:DUF1835 domain-containing protein [Prevotellaceae bacterium]